MMLGLSAIRRLEAHVKRQETRQTIKHIADAFLGGALFVVFVFGAIALTKPSKPMPTASDSVNAAYQRGHDAEVKRINPINWQCGEKK